MTATMPGISNALQDTFSAMRVSSESYGDRVVIIARTGSGADTDLAHDFEARNYVSLQDVGVVHKTSS
jgi:hypothetical protein